MSSPNNPFAGDGLVVVDKPQAWTSHDVVARVRGLAGTRKVGHAGTLDPMATGVLVCGVGRATRLLGRIADTSKTYDATIRLGQSTTTDDAEGEFLAPLTATAAGLAGIRRSRDSITVAMATMTGEISQRPSSVSAIKVEGKRAYTRVREGENVVLAERAVTVQTFELLNLREDPALDVIDIDVRVDCSTGTYVRALARDLGARLGVGGHLIALRRTRVGWFDIDMAHTLEVLAESFQLLPIGQVARSMFVSVDLDQRSTEIVSHGGRLPWPVGIDYSKPVALFRSDGSALAIAEFKGGQLAPVVVWA